MNLGTKLSVPRVGESRTATAESWSSRMKSCSTAAESSSATVESSSTAKVTASSTAEVTSATTAVATAATASNRQIGRTEHKQRGGNYAKYSFCFHTSRSRLAHVYAIASQ